MELTSNQTEQFKKRYLELLDSCGVIKNGSLDFAVLWNKCAPLVNEVNKLRGIKDFISPSELKSSIGDRFYNHRSRFSDINDFDLADKMSSTEKQDAAENFVKFIEGNMQRILFSICILIGLSEELRAENPQLYKCKVTQYFQLEKIMGDSPKVADGPLIRGLPDGPTINGGVGALANTYAHIIVGREFTVDTLSGIIVGADPPANDQARKRIILVNGKGGQSLNLLSVWGPIPATQYLEIKTFVSGRLKPFIVIRDGNVQTGQCE